MQFIFDCSLDNYILKDCGRDIQPPRPTRCPNPSCKLHVPPKKHGGYERYVFSEQYSGLIYIHRFYCPYCGKTFSFLPSFCLPYFQYALSVIFDILYSSFVLELSYDKILLKLVSYFSALSKQHFTFYCHRFYDNLTFIQSGIRTLDPSCGLPSSDLIQKEKAKKVIALLMDSFAPIHIFSQRFHAACNFSFLAFLHQFIPA